MQTHSLWNPIHSRESYIHYQMTPFRLLHMKSRGPDQLLTTLDADVAVSATEDQTALSQVVVTSQKSTGQKSNMQRKSRLRDKQMC